jgi:enoyl-CoA hydratase
MRVLAHDLVMQELLCERHDGWAQLMLNRPEARNALNTSLLAQLADLLDRLAQDAHCRAVLITGAGGHFAAGADIAEIEGKGSAEGAIDPRKGCWARISAFPKPVIAAVDGFCLGGGFELALMTDGIVAGETARFGLPETTLGLMPGAGGGQRLLALVGRMRALRMVLLGEIITSELAEAWGIASWRTSGSALPEAMKIVSALALRAPLALAAAKKAITAGEQDVLAFGEERNSFEQLLDSADKREGISAFREKRKPDFKGQ